VRDNLHYTQLGATLFVPATHKNLDSIISGDKYPNLKSVVIDTEDGIEDDSLLDGLQNIKELLNNLKYTTSTERPALAAPVLSEAKATHPRENLLVFIRPRNVEILEEILGFENIDAIDGFILPKFSLSNADAYLDALQNTKHHIMPSIEGMELFNTDALHKLKDKLKLHRDKIILVRFGLEDMLRQLSMKRECQDSIFDFAVSASVLGNFLAIFKSEAYAVSGGVYPYFSDKDGFVKDVRRDLKEGLFSKTIIHPSQIDTLHEIYKVSKNELSDAKDILENETSIINLNGSMGEGKTMSPYSEIIIKRAKIYGVVNEK